MDEIRPGEMRMFLAVPDPPTRCYTVRCGACHAEEGSPGYCMDLESKARIYFLHRGWRNIPPYAWCCPACVTFLQSVEGQA